MPSGNTSSQKCYHATCASDSEVSSDVDQLDNIPWRAPVPGAPSSANPYKRKGMDSWKHTLGVDGTYWPTTTPSNTCRPLPSIRGPFPPPIPPSGDSDGGTEGEISDHDLSSLDGEFSHIFQKLSAAFGDCGFTSSSANSIDSRDLIDCLTQAWSVGFQKATLLSMILL